jgi:hypothetical protein
LLFWGLKYDEDPGSGMETVRIRDPGWKKVGSRIRDPGWKKVSPMLMKLFSTLFLARLLLWHDVPPIQGHTDRGCSSSSHPPIQRTLFSRIQIELTHALNRP